MLIRIAMWTLVLNLLDFGLSPCSAREEVRVNKPIWHVGDTWKVKIPVMVSKAGEKSWKVGEYTLSMRVLENAKVRGTECYVLQMKTTGDYPDTNQPRMHFAEIAYYKIADLKLMRVEKRSTDKNAGVLSTENALPGQQLLSLTAESTRIPLQLPAFPVMAGHSVVSFRTDYRDKDTLSRVRKGENVATSMSIAESTSADKGPGAASGALRVTFREVTRYSSSPDEELVLLEEVWVPGKPWWSSARVREFGGADVLDYTLADTR